MNDGIDIKELKNALKHKDLIIATLQNKLKNTNNNINVTNSNYSSCNIGENIIINQLKADIINKENQIKNLTQKINELSTELKEANVKLNNYELQSNFQKYAGTALLDKANQEKSIKEDKIKQLVDIIQQFNNNLTEASNENEKLKQDNLSIKALNEKLIAEKENNKKMMDEFQLNYNKYNQLVNINTKNKNIIQNLNKELLEYKNDYNKEINNNKELNNKIIRLVNELSKMENIKQIYNEANNDLSYAKSAINEINMKNKQNEEIINSIRSDVNKNIVILIEYIEKNFDLDNPNNDENFEPIKNIENIQFDALFGCIENTKMNLKKNITNLYNKIKDLESVNEELLNQISGLNNNIADYQNEINNITNENSKLNGIINNINNDILSNKKNNEILQEQINNFSNEKIELNNQINMNKNIFENLKNQNQKLLSVNTSLQDNLKILNKELQEKKENDANIKMNIQILEKKVNNLKTELDLKNIQIQNQEEIINRRNDTNNSCILENDTILIKKLKSDRDNLINDNLMLIQQNNSLKQILKCNNIAMNDGNDQPRFNN